MSSAPIGIVAEQAAKRAVVVERLSPGAKHQAFPRLYAQPLPRPDTTTELVREVARLASDNRRLVGQNKSLRDQITTLSVELEQCRPIGPLPSDVERKRVACAEVIEVYLKALKAGGYLVDDSPMTMDDILSDRKSRKITRPRHVAMWLAYKLIKNTSLPKLGMAFGGRDHATIHHGYAKAPGWMAESPLLRAAALATIAHFESETKDGPT